MSLANRLKNGALSPGSTKSKNSGANSPNLGARTPNQ